MQGLSLAIIAYTYSVFSIAKIKTNNNTRFFSSVYISHFRLASISLSVLFFMLNMCYIKRKALLAHLTLFPTVLIVVTTNSPTVIYWIFHFRFKMAAILKILLRLVPTNMKVIFFPKNYVGIKEPVMGC